MTVKELIARLSELPQDMLVTIPNPEDANHVVMGADVVDTWYWHHIDGVETFFDGRVVEVG